MSNSNDNWWMEVLAWIAAVCAGVAAIFWLGYWVLFGVFWIVPYAVFTLVPLAVLTLGIGYGFKAFCTANFEDQDPHAEENSRVRRYSQSREGLTWDLERIQFIVDKKLIPRTYHGRRLILLFPVVVALTFAAFDLPQSHQTAIDKVIVEPEKKIRISDVDDDVHQYDNEGNEKPHYRIKPAKTRDEVRTIEQWPWLVEAFNNFNARYQNIFPASFLMEGKVYESVLFDRNIWSVVAWLSLLLTGPVLFWLLSEEYLEREEQAQVSNLESRVDQERRSWQEKEAAWKKEEEKYFQRIEQYRTYWQESQQEVKVLTAKLTFTPQGQQAKVVEMSEKPGVLDSDLL